MFILSARTFQLSRPDPELSRALHDLGDDERGILAGGYDRLLMSDEELAKEEEAMVQAQKQGRRKHLKSVGSK